MSSVRQARTALLLCRRDVAYSNPDAVSKWALGNVRQHVTQLHDRRRSAPMKPDRLPVGSSTVMDKEYLTLVGEVVFLYNMYEETLMAIADEYRPGCWEDYFAFRYDPWDVFRTVSEVISSESDERKSAALRQIVNGFFQARDIRAAIAHGVPCTDSFDADRQVLAYYSGASKPPKPGKRSARINSRNVKPSSYANRYNGKILSFDLLKTACEELEKTCSLTRSFYSSVRRD